MSVMRVLLGRAMHKIKLSIIKGLMYESLDFALIPTFPTWVLHLMESEREHAVVRVY